MLCDQRGTGRRKATTVCQRCKDSKDSVQIDKMLQTPKDEVTRFGPLEALQLRLQVDLTFLLVCYRRGLWDRPILQRILEMSRPPFITSHNFMHYCEVCDVVFEECALRPGQKLHASVPSRSAVWDGCPGGRLKFIEGECFTAAEIRKTSNGAWFFKAEVRHYPRRGEEGVVEDQFAPMFKFLWAPVFAFAEGRQADLLAAHLRIPQHAARAEAVTIGQAHLLSRAASLLARDLGESTATSLSRFRTGLGLQLHLCSSADVERARRLESLKNAQLPLKMVQEVFPEAKQLVWITPEQLMDLEEENQQRRRQKGRGQRSK